jgi:hypothetical protein
MALDLQTITLMTLVYLAAYIYIFWLVYIVVMGIYRAHLNGKLNGAVIKTLSFPIVVTGFVMDVLANIFIATIVFLEPPREWLVTDRLIRYNKYDIGWRNKLAEWICKNLLDVFDPTGYHCLQPN